jgi:hypothetical protein
MWLLYTLIGAHDNGVSLFNLLVESSEPPCPVRVFLCGRVVERGGLSVVVVVVVVWL